MMKVLVLLITITSVAGNSFTCPASTGNFKNEDDFRSYYMCTNYCHGLEYCPSTAKYYSSIERTCKNDGYAWSPAYDLTGVQEMIPYVQYRHFHQSGFDVYWSSETKNHMFTFVGRYINETRVAGTETILSLKNKCILIRDIQLTVKERKSFCMTRTINPYSMKCELLTNYDSSNCVTY